MRAVAQRVTNASVTVAGETIGSIRRGLLIFLAIGAQDTREDLDYIVGKTVHLRAFQDEAGKMNLSLLDIAGEVLVVSQFTLFGDCRKGRRPSFSQAAPPEKARVFYNEFIQAIRNKGLQASSGAFQEMMSVSLVNDGPVTFLLDSKKIF